MTQFCYQQAPEETLLIDLPNTDGLKIKGILRSSLEKPVVIMVHGLPGSGNELLQYLGARYLYERGFSSLRLSLYDFEPQTRNLLNCSLDIHASDFDTVVTYLRDKGAPKIFAVGHSYGGLTILRSTAKLDGAVLWDPTHGSFWLEGRDKDYEEDYPTKEVDGMVIGLAGYGYVEPSSMVKENKSMGDTSQWAAHKGYPLKVISAGKGAMTDLGKRYVDAAEDPKAHVVIEDAHHQFEDSDEVVLRLFEETAEWFAEFCEPRL